MLEQLLDTRVALAAAIAFLSVINYCAARVALAEQSRQSVVEYELLSAAPGGDPVSDQAQLIKPFVMTTIIIAVVFFADRFTREVLGGGWLVTQVASLGSNTTDLFSFKALHNRDAAHGRIHYSAAYRYQVAAARAFGMAIVAAAVGWLVGSWSFVGGAMFMVATGAGWYRRARQFRAN